MQPNHEYAEQMIIFGGTGDLTKRKLLPALLMSHLDNLLPENFTIIGIGRDGLNDQTYRNMLAEALKGFVPALQDGTIKNQDLQEFLSRIHFCQLNASQAEDYATLKKVVETGKENVKEVRRVFYLATTPLLFISICQNLAAVGLNTIFSRVVLEKPLGHDLSSAQGINQAVAKYFQENQIFRIDHYLGKETVQNLMALRFGNAIFEPLWRAPHIRNVQITVSEEVGVGSRAEFYDGVGALRDMVQNHLLQLLCLVAMEPPTAMTPDAVRDEKLRVLRSLAPFTPETFNQWVVRGQYTEGVEVSKGKKAVGYLQEKGVAANSTTETFIAMQVAIDSWRWAGVPFFLRTGKRLPRRLSEIVINFAPVPYPLFADSPLQMPNRLVIHLQPDETVRLHLMAKRPGEGMTLQPVSLNLDFSETFKGRQADAYERLLLDVIAGRLTLFMRHDELEAAWRWIDPLQNYWQQARINPKPYAAGTWGPAAAAALIARAEAEWSEAL